MSIPVGNELEISWVTAIYAVDSPVIGFAPITGLQDGWECRYMPYIAQRPCSPDCVIDQVIDSVVGVVQFRDFYSKVAGPWRPGVATVAMDDSGA